MRSLNNLMKRVGQKFFSIIPFRTWLLVEIICHRNLVKGWGASSISQEVAAIKQLANEIGLVDLTCLDVGANVGEWSLAFHKLAPHANIYCFEPSNGAFRQLKQSIEGVDQIFPFKTAIGNEEGEVIIYSVGPESGLNSLSKRRLNHFEIEMNAQEQVLITTLDNWISLNHVSPKILKLDIEGHELAALQGATKLLKSLSIIQFEFGGANIDTRTFFQDFWYLLTPLGFTFYRLGPKGLMPIVSYKESDEVFLTTNYFAVRS